MIMAVPMMLENIWFDKWRCDEAERLHQERLAGVSSGSSQVTKKGGSTTIDKPASSLVSEIARAREQIQKSLKQEGGATVVADNAVISRIESLEAENHELRKITDDLRQLVKNLENRVKSLESNQTKPTSQGTELEKEKGDEGDDDDFELFGSDDEDDEEAEKLKQQRLEQYAAKKAKKTQVIAKSSIVFDVKPWDDETDMKAMEDNVRTIEMDGLVWGASKLVPVGYGIKKLQIMMVIEDEKISVDEVQEKIEEFEDYVQSVDVAAFNKI